MAAFTSNMDTALSPEEYYANVDTNLNMIKTAAYVTTTLIADLVIVSRSSNQTARDSWFDGIMTGVPHIHCLGQEYLGHCVAPRHFRSRYR